jgi:NitT/TauT family transport system permease protein
VGLGVPLGLLMGRYRKLESFLDIYMTALLAVPMISFIPVLVIAFGLGLHSRVWIVFLFAFVIIAVNTTAGVRNVDPTLTEMARAFGARESELFLKVILPAALPMIMAGIRLGMGRAILGMVTSEMILSAVGFGVMLMTFGASFNTPALFATLLTIVLLAVALLRSCNISTATCCGKRLVDTPFELEYRTDPENNSAGRGWRIEDGESILHPPSSILSYT